MSGSRQLADHLVDLLAPLGPVGLRRFFGGWALTLDGVQFAMVMDTLYLCADEASRPALQAQGSVPFAYLAGSRRVVVQRYYSAPTDTLDDPARLCPLARAALRAAREHLG